MVPERHRPLLAVFVALLLSGVVFTGLVGIVLPARTPPELPAAGSPPKALARRLLLVVVDGLRFDVATDPARMPRFSRALATETGGPLMAGRVSMTTSAVLAMGTGQRGSFEQVVRNVGPAPTPMDSWLVQAKKRGLRLMTVGDPAWPEMFPSAIEECRSDPKGVAIDVDFNPQTFRDARELAAKRPDVLVVHFVTPDHQAHAHRVPSERYAAHMRGFDRDLFAFLDELPRDTTVVVAGDHGAADSGTHGADVPVQRLTAVFARGPGISPGVRANEPIDQVDLAATFAALLGLPAPRHSRGHLLVEWLDAAPRERARLACESAERAVAYGRALGFAVAAEPCDASRPVEAFAASRASVARVDAAIETVTGLSSKVVPMLLAAVVLLGIAAAFVALGPGALRGIAAALGLLALSVALTFHVERLPGNWPNLARIALFALGNVPALLLLLVPGKLGRVAERASWLAPCIVPGLLVATHTAGAQPESWVAVAVGGLVLVLLGGLGAERPTLRWARNPLHPAHLALFFAGIAWLFFAGTRENELYPAFLRDDPRAMLGAAAVLLVLTSFALFARARPRRWLSWALGAALALCLALYLRRHVAPIPGRIVILVGLAATLLSALRDRRLPALLAGLFTYCWISRDHEILALAPTVLVADAAGAAFARHRAERGEGGAALRLPDLLLVSAFLFGLAFVQRVGVQGAIDFGSMDWGVAGFGDAHVSAWTVGLALGTKYALGLVLVIGAFASELGPRVADGLLRACFAMFTGRAVVLGAMFLVAGGSFWTGLRVLGDVPFGLLWMVVSALAWVAVRRTWDGPRYSSVESSSS